MHKLPRINSSVWAAQYKQLCINIWVSLVWHVVERLLLLIIWKDSCPKTLWQSSIKTTIIGWVYRKLQSLPGVSLYFWHKKASSCSCSYFSIASVASHCEHGFCKFVSCCHVSKIYLFFGFEYATECK